MDETPQILKDLVQHLPTRSGVYLMKNSRGDIIYIGKARVLFDRVRSYFQKSGDLSPKTQLMVSQVADIETIVTKSELEALILESNLVKRHRPQFNIVLRDDKHYPYLRFPIRDRFPRLSIVRRVKKDGALYFGPYVPAGALRQTIKVIRKVFPLATCTIDIDGSADRACLEFEIKRCMAPCTGNQTREEYHQIVKQVRLFLEGRDSELIEGLESEMLMAANQEHFEEAARLRDQIHNIKRTLEKQRVAQIGPVDQDVIGMARMGPALDIQLLFVRGGLLIGRKDFFLPEAKQTSDEEVIQATIEQFYNKDSLPPREILIPSSLGETIVIQEWLSEKRGTAVRVVVPERGVKYRLLQLAQENATAALSHHLRGEAAHQQAVTDLQRLIGMKNPLSRIEGFDISNTMGNQSVASMVVWEAGQMKKTDYRRFRIKSVEGANDFASMHEVVLRRYGGSLSPQEEAGLPLPDLVIIDGGLGQLQAAREAFSEIGLPQVAVIGLAKARDNKKERIFIPGKKQSIDLKVGEASTLLLQRIRDEAHRFAITYHRKLRGKALLTPTPLALKNR